MKISELSSESLEALAYNAKEEAVFGLRNLIWRLLALILPILVGAYCFVSDSLPFHILCFSVVTAGALLADAKIFWKITRDSTRAAYLLETEAGNKREKLKECVRQ